MKQLKPRKPLRTIVRVVGNEQVHTLEKPFVIHYPGRNKNVSNRHAKKTFAINFFSDTVLITVARCSKKDQFCRRIGNNVATGRLEKLTADYLLNGRYGSGFSEKQPCCKVVSIDEIESFPNSIFDQCSIPSDVVEYILDIYNRFVLQTTTEGSPSPTQDIPF